MSAHRLALVLCLAGVPALAHVEVGQAPSTQPTALCPDTRACRSLGEAALQAGDLSAALIHFRREVEFADEADDYTARFTAQHDMVELWMRKRDYLRARSWAIQAKLWDPTNAANEAALRDIEKKVAAYKWPTEISGLYVKYAGMAVWDTLRIGEPKSGKIALVLAAQRMTPAWRTNGPGSIGDLDVMADLIAPRQARYVDRDPDSLCDLTLHFNVDRVEVAQRSDCGFGHNVSASGVWIRVCSGNGPERQETPSGR